jgi:3-oxoacyl-(acyl-carrier-protein) synthase
VSRVALACAALLFDDAGFRPEKEVKDEIGMALGTFTAGLDSVVEYMTGLTEHGPAGVPAILFSNTVSNAPASLCAIEFVLRGPNVTFNQREVSSLAAILFSMDAIRNGRTSAMVSGGADCVEETFFKVYDRFRALSPMRRGENRHRADEVARPFDRCRNGAVLGEGGYLVLLESASAAERRGARAYGEILGAGLTAASTPLNQWPAEPSGLVRAMRLALADARIGPDAIAAVFATANGSPELDRLEAAAIHDVFGSRAIPVASLKGAIGESSAAGAAGLVVGLLSIPSGNVVPTVGFAEVDPACALSVSNRTQRADGDIFLVNSVASGGTQGCLVVRAMSRA